MILNFQLAENRSEVPTEENFLGWAGAALKYLEQDNSKEVSLCIRVVDEEEISKLNQDYRNKSGSTNVLSFPQEIPEQISAAIHEKALGDILLCAPVIEREAEEQGKTSIAHWAHLTIHGVLHLLDYDHETTAEAEQMESLEIAILNQLGFANPYETNS